jgi:hypothetical protein
MLKETFRKTKDALRFRLITMLEDEYPRNRMKGEIFWEMRDGVTGEVTKGHVHNVVTLDAGILLATFMKGTGTAVTNQCVPDFGVYALAVGTGDVGWDPLNPPSATDTQRSLYNELARKAVASTDFIDDSGGISAVRTHIVDFTTTFSESEAVGVLTEMGLIGGDCSTNMSVRNPILPPNGTYDPTVDVSGKDILVNYVTFPAITKPPTSTLTWTWRLTW